MNPMVLNMLEQYLGKDRMQGLMAQWNAMTPQQQQVEMQKVMSMTPEQQQQYLGQKGIDMNSLVNQANTNTTPQGNNGGGRFNY